MKTRSWPRHISADLFCELALSLVPDLPETVLAPLYDAHEVRSFRPGEFLMVEGDDNSGVFILSGGTVQLLLRHGALKRERIDVHRISSPAILGLPDALLGGCFVAGAQAVTKVEAVFIPRAKFMEALREFPAASIAFSKVLSEELNSIYQRLSAMRMTHYAQPRSHSSIAP